MDQAARGATALNAGNYDEAIKQYTAAISVNNRAVDYYIKRSTAYQRAKKYSEALADAEVAVKLAHQRSRRELIKDSQMRRAVSLYHNERYGDAKFVLGIVKKLDEKEKTIPIWEAQVEKKLEGLEEGDERAKVEAKEVPDVELPTEKKESAVKVEAAGKDSGVAQIEGNMASTSLASQPTPASKIKHQYYDTNDTTVVTLLAKGVSKDKVSVDIEKDSLSISFPVVDRPSDFNFTIDPLYAEVDPSASTYRVTPTKIEVTLKKASPGLRWKALEGSGPASMSSGEQTTIPSHVLSSKANGDDQPPSYPTSSKKGVKNWDKVAKELTSPSNGEKEDPYEDFEGGDDAGRFFKGLYAGATPEQRRAMMKSYQESGGTVLSTDWSDVGSKTIVPQPPDGMEARKWS
jgi:suppressor of G2 allele of SKP1